MASGCPFLSRNEDDAYFFLEDMASYDYHWHLSHYNAQEHYDPLENCKKMLEHIDKNTREMREERLEFNRRPKLVTISFNDELVHKLVHEDILLHEEPIKQQFEEEPSFPEEVETSPQEAKECVLLMTLTSPQPTPNIPKIHPFPFALLTPSYGEVPYFVDYQDTWPTVLFKLTYFMARSPRVVDYATLHGMTPYYEDTENLANDLVLFGRQPKKFKLYFYSRFYFFFFIPFILVFLFCFGFDFWSLQEVLTDMFSDLVCWPILAKF